MKSLNITKRKPNSFSKAEVKNTTQWIEHLVARGLVAHQKDKLLEAKAIYDQVLTLQPTNYSALYLVGTILAQTKNYTQAIEFFAKAIQINPNLAPCYFNYGLALQELNRMDDAIVNYDKAILIKPDYAEAHSNRGNALQKLNRLNDAINSYDLAIIYKPDFADAYSNRSIALKELKRFDEALASCDKAININPEYVGAHSNRGNILLKLKRIVDALESYNKALSLQPDCVEVYINYGIALQELKRPDEALSCYDKAIKIKPENVEAHSNRGNVLQELERFDDALASYDQAVLIKPDYAEAHSNRGNALQKLNRLNDAINSYDLAIIYKPDFADAYSNRSIALKELKRFDEALASCNKAININPLYVEALSNRGNVFQELKRFDDALASYDQAILIKPEYAEVYSNRGNTLKGLKRFDEALASFQRAIIIKPYYVEAYINYGIALQELNRFNEAISCYEKAISINDDADWLLGYHLHTKMFLCDWSQFKTETAGLIKKIQLGKKTSTPFNVLSITDDPALQKKASEIYIKSKHQPKNDLGNIKKRPHKNKIKIGYYSADFKDHAVSILTAELFELHNRSNFEIYAFSFENNNDEMNQRLRNTFDHFLEVSNRSDLEVANLSRQLEIDIAIDLGGFTTSSRTDIFSYRAAPIQIGYIGYLGTLGTNYFDYIFADSYIIPTEAKQYYSEKIIYLPSYQVNDRKRLISNRKFTKFELGLPDDCFVFCCFNNNFKITPHTFNGWMNILNAVEKSVLFLYIDNDSAKFNLQKEAQNRGINPTRLVFASRIIKSEYLARYCLADLFLDTFPYNAGTTASDALWVGLPVLTLEGRSFASRVAASLLNAIELPELITNTQESYEAMAIELATNPEKLNGIKKKLFKNRMTTPLFNTELS